MGAHTPQFLRKEGEGAWLLSTCNVPSVTVSMSCSTGNKPMEPSAITVTIVTVRGPFSLLQYQDKGRLPVVKQQIVAMTLNGSGVRDIVRVLRVSSATVINVLKKKEPTVQQVNARLLHTLDPPHVNVILRQVEQAEMDAMWSFVVRRVGAM